ncbi:cell wall-binding repeat-containing protein [Euzebya rosea]|uniref:cell wall-binding repeat-containing protein n=1 Tax=Euzebya rosea TaxID=2052804 RepID=UPI0013005561|nr:cell wall-binding repeat-containing protein [Euzebya rosea]
MSRFAVLVLALVLLGAAQEPPGAPPSGGVEGVAVDDAVDRLLALPYTPLYQPQGTDSAFGDDGYPSAFPATDTAGGEGCCVGPVPDQPPLADLAPPFADFPATFDRIQLTSADGTPLHAMISIVPGAPGIVVAQGFNTNGKHSIVRYAAFLRANGYSVIAPDHRDMGREWVRGGSWHPSGERRGQTIGWKEGQDFLAAAQELHDRGVPAIGMLGFSEGAQNTLLALAEDHHGVIDAVMTFSGPADQATQGTRNDVATAALLTTVVNNPDLCGYLQGVGAREEFSASPNHILRHGSAVDAVDGIIGGAPVDRVPGVHFYAADDTLVQDYHATLLASRTNELQHHRTVLVRAGNHAYFYDRWWTQAAALEWFGTWLDPDGMTTAQPTVAQSAGGAPMADQVTDLSTVSRADGDAERSPVDACPAADDPVGPTALAQAVVTDEGAVTVDLRRSWAGWDDHRLVGWSVDWTDGTTDEGDDIADGLVTHTFAEPGPRTIVVSVTDDTGATDRAHVAVDVPGRVERLAGPGRVATALAVSRATFEAADRVVVASADGFADALAAAPLAFQLGSPILLVGDTLEPAVVAELIRLRALEVQLVGGTAAIGEDVEAALVAAGFTVRRTGGPDRYATAALLAAEVGGAAGGVLVVDGTSFPDAVAASGLAARGGMPLLLVEGGPTGSVPTATATALQLLDPATVTVVGGEAVVPADVAEAVGATARLAGADRYTTSIAVADASLALGLRPTRTWLATGTDFPDALAVGVASARSGDVMLLVDGATPADDVSDVAAWLADHGVVRLTVAGGEDAVVPSSVDGILPG